MARLGRVEGRAAAGAKAMRIALLDKRNLVTNVLALAPGVKPEDLKRVDRWQVAPQHPILPGWRYDPDKDRFLPPRQALARG